MLRVTSWVVAAIAALLAVESAFAGRALPTALWSLLGISNLLTALGLDERSPAIRRVGQVLSAVVFVLALVYLYTLFAG